MNLIISTVLQEKQRIDYMLEKYQEVLAELPKGTISEKQVKGHTYPMCRKTPCFSYGDIRRFHRIYVSN